VRLPSYMPDLAYFGETVQKSERILLATRIQSFPENVKIYKVGEYFVNILGNLRLRRPAPGSVPTWSANCEINWTVELWIWTED